MDAPSPLNLEISEPAKELHKKTVIIDGHNDSLSKHWSRKESMDLGTDWPAYHVDLRRMRAGGLTALNSMVGYKNLVESFELWDGMYLNSSAHPDDFLLVDRAGDILKAKQEGKIGLIGQIESCCVLNNNLSVLRVMYKLGVRVAGLTHGAAREYDLQAAKSPFDFCSPADREKARKKTSVPIRVRLKY